MLKDPSFIQRFIEKEANEAGEEESKAAVMKQPEESKDEPSGGAAAAVNMDQT